MIFPLFVFDMGLNWRTQDIFGFEIFEVCTMIATTNRHY